MTPTQKKNLVEKLAKKYAKKLNIGHWKINVVIEKEQLEDVCAKIRTDHR